LIDLANGDIQEPKKCRSAYCTTKDGTTTDPESHTTNTSTSKNEQTKNLAFENNINNIVLQPTNPQSLFLEPETNEENILVSNICKKYRTCCYWNKTWPITTKEVTFCHVPPPITDKQHSSDQQQPDKETPLSQTGRKMIEEKRLTCPVAPSAPPCKTQK
jgi:hypothetical protein